MRSRLPHPCVAIADSVAERSQPRDHRYQASDHILEPVVQIWTRSVNPKKFRDDLELLLQVPFVVTRCAGQANFYFPECRLKERPRRRHSAVKVP